MKHAMPEGDANEAASLTYGRRPVAQRKANTFSKPTQMAMPESDQKRLCATFVALYRRRGRNGRSLQPRK